MTPFSHHAASEGAEDRARAFAVVSTWPDTKNAEFEVIERLVAAARNIGAEVFVIDDDGYVLSTGGTADHRIGRRISAGFCEFVISLHFQSPRLYDLYSYVTLWNPPDFYHDFGYRPSTEKLASHSDFLSCHSDMADAHAANLMAGLGRPVAQPFATLFHSLPEPFLAPRIDAGSRLFYIGINWERISGTRGRHQDLLEHLDREDLISIYGPEEFYGVRPWEGFRNYRGSIPFDGRSVLAELNRAGICLAFSSRSHQQSGIMSNRLFEGLAAGAVLVANPHPFIDRYFADCVYVVDDAVDSSRMAEKVRGIVEDIRRDPRDAIARAERGQARLRERFSLEFCLRSLFEGHRARAAARPAFAEPLPEVSVVLLLDGGDPAELEAMIANAARQEGVRVDLVAICDPGLCRDAGAGEEAGLRSVRAVDAGSASRGRLVADALKTLATPYVCLMEAQEHWFADHLASLVEALRRSPESSFACSGRIIEDTVRPERLRRRLDKLGFEEFAEIVAAVHPGDAGRFLFRADVLSSLPEALLPLLHGCEPRAARLWAFLSGRLALSNHATFVHKQSFAEDDGGSGVSEERQVDYILDSVRANPVWLRLRAELIGNQPLRHAGTRRIDLGRFYLTRLGQDGAGFLRSGFSAVETHFTWIDGPTARFEFELPAGTKDARLVLLAGGRDAYGSEAPQRLTILANGKTLVENAPVPEDGARVRAALPDFGTSQPTKVRVTLRLAHAEQVRGKKGQVVDPRYLGMQLSGFGVFQDRFPTLELGRDYPLREGGEGVDALGDGFAPPESHFTWIDGKTGNLTFELPAGTEDARLVLVAAGRNDAASDEPQRLTILANGETVLEDASVPDQDTRLHVPLPDFGGSKPAKVRVTLRLAHAERVRDQKGQVVDPRYLGMQLSGFGVFQDRFPTLELGRDYPLREGGDELAVLGDGFSPPDAYFTWIDGKTGHMMFALPPGEADTRMTIWVGGRPEHQTGMEQRLTILANGKVLVDNAVVSEAMVELDAVLPAGSSKIRLTLQLGHAEPYRDANGTILDHRLLGLHVLAIRMSRMDETPAGRP